MPCARYEKDGGQLRSTLHVVPAGDMYRYSVGTTAVVKRLLPQLLCCRPVGLLCFNPVKGRSIGQRLAWTCLGLPAAISWRSANRNRCSRAVRGLDFGPTGGRQLVRTDKIVIAADLTTGLQGSEASPGKLADLNLLKSWIPSGTPS